MKEALFLGALIGSIVVALGRALLIDEMKGRLQRRARRRLEIAIAELPADLQGMWATTWREQFAAVVAMPLAAAQYVKAVRLLPRSLEDAELEVERAIASLPVEQREEWADEWRAELAALAANPTRAAEFAGGVQQSARRLGNGRVALSGPQVRASSRGAASAAPNTRRFRGGLTLGERPGAAAVVSQPSVGRLPWLGVAKTESGNARVGRLGKALEYVEGQVARLPRVAREYLVCGACWTVLYLAGGPRLAVGLMACPFIALISWQITRWLES